jgi:hypothetical protein
MNLVKIETGTATEVEVAGLTLQGGAIVFYRLLLISEGEGLVLKRLEGD